MRVSEEIRNEAYHQFVKTCKPSELVIAIKALLSDGRERNFHQIAQELRESEDDVQPRISEMMSGKFGIDNLLKVARKGHYVNGKGRLVPCGYYTLVQDPRDIPPTLFG